MEKQENLLRKKAHKLGIANTSRISVWLEKNAARIGGMYCQEIADLCRKELAIEMPVGQQTIRDICRPLNVAFKQKAHLSNGHAGKKSSGLQRVTALEQRVAELEKALASLEAQLGVNK